MTTTTNAVLAVYHAAEAKKYAALARRDAGLSMTEENAEYLSETQAVLQRANKPTADEGLDFLDDAAPKVQILPQLVPTIDPAELENLLAAATVFHLPSPRKGKATVSTPEARLENFLAGVSCTEERLTAACALPAKAKAEPAAKKPLVAKKPAGGGGKKERTGPTPRQAAALRYLATVKTARKADVMANTTLGAGWVSETLGSDDEAKTAHYDAKWGTTLVTMGFVECVGEEVDGAKGRFWQITPEGRKWVKANPG